MSVAEKCYFKILMGCGLLPFRLHTPTARFVESKRHYWFSIACAVLFSIIVPFFYWAAINSVTHPQTPINSMMIVLQFLFMYIVIMLTRIEAILHHRQLRELLNALLELRAKVSRMSRKGQIALRGASVKLWLKLVLVDVGLMMVSAAFFNDFNDDGFQWWYMIAGCINLGLMSIMNMTINLLLVALYSGEQIYETINRNSDDRQGHRDKMGVEAYQWYLVHTATASVVERIVKNVNKPLFVLNIFYFFIIVFSIFYLFTSIVQDMRTGSEFNMVNPIAFFLSEAFQVYYIVSASSAYSERARQIVPILGTYNVGLIETTDEHTTELLIIDYLSRDYSISVAGMYTVDYTMLFSIVSSTTSFMIILVQSYLQE
ncbi:uncharacterized protein LOC126571910 [Anopheles aquasalis]|uniref:uncharacterized protein LOC126571910 n=1 Tax=Anopheles aquasalis TaxID=42839 RepID=UPI00215B40BC|nr:uncharacterized protein LOC126571910 [Anopheles aquasalis]